MPLKMNKLLSKDTFGEIVRFGIVGCIATILHYVIYYFLNKWINLSVAYAVGYALSFIANFFLTAAFTFKKKATVKRGLGFGGAHLVNFLLQLALLNLFVYLGINKNLAPIPVYMIAIPVNFLMVRFIFKKDSHFE